MENKINVAEFLKDCPKGMELDCALYENLEFDYIEENSGNVIIVCRVKILGDYNIHTFTKYGCYSTKSYAKCVIFPKGKTTWEGFVPPCKFKNGDIVYIKTKGHNHNEYIIIFKEIKNDHIHKYVCFAYQHLSIDKCALCHLVDSEIMRLATEEEKQKLFQAIKDNGYKWNPDTKEIEKFEEDKPRWNPDTLQPFDKVIGKRSGFEIWEGDFFLYRDDPYWIGIGGMIYTVMIPYNDETKHLLGTEDEAPEYYRV